MASPIPIQNIYFLLCYAWNQLEEKEVVEIDTEDSTTLQDLFARVLAGGVRYLIRRGFDRGYILHVEETPRLRGKIDFTESMKHQLWLRGRMQCEFDELSYDVPHNRILKTTMQNLLHTEGIETDPQERLGEMLRYLGPVSTPRLTSRSFQRIQLHNGNRYYRFLLNICEIIYQSLLPSENPGKSKFKDFTRDDNQMSTVFEHFVRNFYTLEQNRYRVSRAQVSWYETGNTEAAQVMLPRMLTDVTMESEDRKIILDCKYYREAFQAYHSVRKFRSENLYQLFTYLKNKETATGWGSCEGILLYPTITETFRHSVELHGHPITIASVNLNQNWQNIREELLDLVS